MDSAATTRHTTTSTAQSRASSTSTRRLAVEISSSSIPAVPCHHSASCSGDQCSAEAWQALRISVSFNYDGSWELLSDINAGYASNGA
eukprot:gene1305-955_t